MQSEDERTIALSQLVSEGPPLSLKVTAVIDKIQSGYIVYKTRWYILCFFSLAAALQNVLWLTYNTMGDFSKQFYQISDATVNMFSTIAVIVFVIAVVPIALLANNYGLRKSMLVAAGLLLTCGVGRCFFPGSNMIAIIFILQVANAIVAPIVNSTPSMLATVWFPPEERAIATAVAFLAQFLGTAVAFLLGFVVNSTADISKRIWIEAALSLAVGIPILVYFPDGPPTPPSASSLRKVEEPQSAVGRHFVKELNRSQMISDVREGLPPKAPLIYQALEYLQDVKKLGSSRAFWLATAAGSIPAGLYAAWSGILTQILLPIGYDETRIAWIGLSTALAAVIGGVIVGRVAGSYPTNLKEIVNILLLICCVSSTWFVAAVFELLPNNLASLVISAAITSFTMNATTPLFFELTIELTYPSPETATGSILTLGLNAIGVIYMLLQNVLSGVAINVLFIVLVFISLFLMYSTPVEYKRTAVDRAGLVPPPLPTGSASNSLSASQQSTDSVPDPDMRQILPPQAGHDSLRVRME